MTKFFDFCDKHQRLFFLVFVALLSLLWLIPDTSLDGDAPLFIEVFDHTSTIIDRQSALDNTAPELVGGIGDANRYMIPFAVCACICTVLFLGSLIVNIVIFLARGTEFLFVPIVFSLLSMLLVATQTNISSDFISFDVEICLNPVFYAALALFALYVLYLLLRRFYVPAKARVVASVERRKASRKPTKDERIAELEKRVAELESKDKD